MKDFDQSSEEGDAGELPGGSLADAIAAHLELKKEHGADPDEVALEEASALGQADRDSDSSVDLHPAGETPFEQAREPEPEPMPEPEPEPEPPHHTELISEPLSADPANAALDAVAVPFEVEVNDEPAPTTEATGSFEFEFGEEQSEADAPTPKPGQTQEQAQAEHDLLEDTPDFFQETPEHDKLWFDEAPPRKFDF